MTLTASSETPRPEYPGKTSRPPCASGSECRPPCSPTNETSLPPPPRVVPSTPDTERSCVPRDSNCTVHNPPTWG